MVAEIFKKFQELTRNGGSLSYFEYRALPAIKRVALSDERLAEFDDILSQKANFYRRFGTRSATVFINAPPAKVLHHRLADSAIPANA